MCTRSTAEGILKFEKKRKASTGEEDDLIEIDNTEDKRQKRKEETQHNNEMDGQSNCLILNTH